MVSTNMLRVAGAIKKKKKNTDHFVNILPAS